MAAHQAAAVVVGEEVLNRKEAERQAAQHVYGDVKTEVRLRCGAVAACVRVGWGTLEGWGNGIGSLSCGCVSVGAVAGRIHGDMLLFKLSCCSPT